MSVLTSKDQDITKDCIKQSLLQAKDVSLEVLKGLMSKLYSLNKDLCSHDLRRYNFLHTAIYSVLKASEKQQTAIIDWLLTEREIDPNQPTGNKAGQDTPLHLAAKLGITAAVDRLVECNMIPIMRKYVVKKLRCITAAEGFHFSISSQDKPNEMEP